MMRHYTNPRLPYLTLPYLTWKDIERKKCYQQVGGRWSRRWSRMETSGLWSLVVTWHKSEDGAGWSQVGCVCVCF